MYNWLCLFLLFIIYSFIGYIAEVISCSIHSKKFIWNRGFLIGPYLPIYGTGALLLVYTLGRYRGDLLALFIMSMVYCTILEYFTSLILEKIFHLRWWDYSEKKFNLNGRVCLSNGILFGIGGILIVQFINPVISTLVFSISYTPLLLMSLTILILFVVDLIVSLRIMVGIKVNLGKFQGKDATEQIKNEVVEFLTNHSVLTTRLLNSFPNIERINGKAFEKFVKHLSNAKYELGKISLTNKKHK